MRSNHEQLRFSAGRQALTLVELLVVCVIIAMLAALTLFAASKVAHSSKVTKTRSTIQKLDVAMRQIFETYEEKFADIKRRVYTDYSDLPGVTETQEERQERLATIVAHFIRDLMRVEMPQSGTEVLNPPLGKITYKEQKYPADDKSPLVDYSLQKYYQEATKTNVETPSSRLLFLIIQNLNPEALEAFHGSEIGDPDGNGLQFLDAWGRPIRFLRWAPAFLDSDIQQADRRIFPDPTDERTNAKGWFLYPLIYSAGADGEYGIEEGENIPPTVGDGGILDPFAAPHNIIGGQKDPKSHFDNIHNHQWYRSF